MKLPYLLLFLSLLLLSCGCVNQSAEENGKGREYEDLLAEYEEESTEIKSTSPPSTAEEDVLKKELEELEIEMEKAKRDTGSSPPETQQTTGTMPAVTGKTESLKYAVTELPYREVFKVIDLNGKPACGVIANEMDENGYYSKGLVMYDGMETGGQYKSVHNLINAGGKLAYIADDGWTGILVYDGREMERDRYINEIVSVDGKLAYLGYDGKDMFIAYGEKEIKLDRDAHYFMGDLRDVNGKLTYMLGEEHDKMYIMYDGNEYGREYDYAYFPASLNGKFAYIGTRNEHDYIVTEEGETLLGDARKHRELTEVNGKPAWVRNVNGKYCLVYDGQQLECHDQITYPMEIHGKLTYVACDGRECDYVDGKSTAYIVHNGVIGESYDRISYLAEVGGKITFAARKDGKWYLVQET